MDDNQKHAADTSPCVGICALTEESVCIGCGRTNDEVRRWLSMTIQEREQAAKIAAKRLADI